MAPTSYGFVVRSVPIGVPALRLSHRSACRLWGVAMRTDVLIAILVTAILVLLLVWHYGA